MIERLCWLLSVLAFCVVGLAYLRYRQRYRQPRRATVTVTVQRLLKPRTPNDCPACHHQSVAPRAISPPAPHLIPWREVKSRRGAPKRDQH